MSLSQVRLANEGDMGRLVELRTELYVADNAHFGDVNTEWPRSDEGRDDLGDYLDDPDQLCLVFDEGPVVTGYLLGVVRGRSSAMAGRRAEVEEIYVAPEGRRQRRGSELLAGFTAWMLAKEADRARVGIFASNTVSQAFFMANGYGPYLVWLQHRPEPYA